MKVRAAVVQAAPAAFDRARTLEKLADLVSQAARQGAELAVFPEAFVSAYPKGLDFGAVVGRRTREGREQFRRYFDSAVEVPGPDVDRMARMAREHRVHLVVGAIERDGGTLYCTVLFFAEDGRFLGKHRKLMPTAAERLVWGFGDGSTLSVFDTRLGRLGAVICWENYMPMLRMAMYSKGVQLYCAPTADDRETWLPTVRHVALEGRCFVLSACQVLRRRDLPADIPNAMGDSPETLLMRGGSCIIDPLGKVLAGPAFDEETTLFAELDMDEIARGKYDFDVAGHYARPDVFRLSVDERPAKPVVAREHS
ncbi:MAG TPA: carbon-nitrogen hydrolase family protein [Myxococcales bacterium]|nr:carbon-nitrogen hydrolase family protein [Myxococcales bacterium]